MKQKRVDCNIYCCGCRACEQICPVKAITMKFDEEGFLRANIDYSICVSCGKCYAVCPVNGSKNLYKREEIYYAAYSKKNSIIRNSSSGGLFSVFANYFLDEGGTVYACRFDSDLNPIHDKITNEEEIDYFRRSKYIQSDTKNTFSLAREDLEKGRLVLYVGTPCQISGLKSFLGKEYDNLFCIDLICHGVPSSKLFKENIAYWEGRYKSKLKCYEFRKKPRYYYYYFFFFLETMTGKKIEKPYFYDAYYEAFYNFKDYNEICYSCPYARPERTGDVTIGDFHWAINHHKELTNSPSYSISCLLINSKQGKAMVEAISDNLIMYETKWNWIIERNRNLLKPTLRPKWRDYFYSDIKRLGYTRFVRRYYFSESFLKNFRFFSIFFRAKKKFISMLDK